MLNASKPNPTNSIDTMLASGTGAGTLACWAGAAVTGLGGARGAWRAPLLQCGAVFALLASRRA